MKVSEAKKYLNGKTLVYTEDLEYISDGNIVLHRSVFEKDKLDSYAKTIQTSSIIDKSKFEAVIPEKSPIEFKRSEYAKLASTTGVIYYNLDLGFYYYLNYLYYPILPESLFINEDYLDEKKYISPRFCDRNTRDESNFIFMPLRGNSRLISDLFKLE